MTPTASGLQYVVLHHSGYGEDHFDLMLETYPMSALLTFRSPTWPIVGEVQLTLLHMHRRGYLSYEGPVSDNRGRVKRIARGTYERGGKVDQMLITFTSGTDQKPLVITLDARAIPAASIGA